MRLVEMRLEGRSGDGRAGGASSGGEGAGPAPGRTLTSGVPPEILAPVDVIVSGGGVGGVACAVVLADCGLKVAVVERRGALGWEVGRARRVFLDLERAAERSKVAAEILKRLVEHGAYRAGVIHAPIAEIVFDQMLAERGVEPLFHAWPVAVAPAGERDRSGDGEASEGREDRADRNGSGGVTPGKAAGEDVRGLVVATKEGYGLIQAPVVVETDECGRLVERALRVPLGPRPVRRALVVGVEGGVDLAKLGGPLQSAFGYEPQHGVPRELRHEVQGQWPRELHNAADQAQVEVRPLGGGLVQVDVLMAQPGYAEREFAFPVAARRAIAALKGDPALAGAGIVYIADDEWGGPAFTLSESAIFQPAGILRRSAAAAGREPCGALFTAAGGGFEIQPITARDLAFAGEVVLAGPWLPAAVRASNTEEVEVLNRICLGEAAARLVRSALRP